MNPIKSVFKYGFRYRFINYIKKPLQWVIVPVLFLFIFGFLAKGVPEYYCDSFIQNGGD